MKMTVRHHKYVNEDNKIVEVEGYTVHTPDNAIDCLRCELRTMQSMWPIELAGYEIRQKRTRK